MDSSQSINSSFASYSPTKHICSVPLNAIQNCFPQNICTGAAQRLTLIKYLQFSEKLVDYNLINAMYGFFLVCPVMLTLKEYQTHRITLQHLLGMI